MKSGKEDEEKFQCRNYSHRLRHCGDGRETGGKALKPAVRKNYFIRDISFNSIDKEYELETGSVSTDNMSLVLLDPSINTRTAWEKSNSAHDVFSKSNMENAITLMGSFMASGAHEHIFCSDLMLYSWKRSHCAVRRNLNDMEGHLGEEEKCLSVVVEVKD